jgi:hypothetical protein
MYVTWGNSCFSDGLNFFESMLPVSLPLHLQIFVKLTSILWPEGGGYKFRSSSC